MKTLSQIFLLMFLSLSLTGCLNDSRVVNEELSTLDSEAKGGVPNSDTGKGKKPSDSIICQEGDVQSISCSLENTTDAKQGQICQNNAWVDSGSCYAVSCSSGYELQNSICVAIQPTHVCQEGATQSISCTLANATEAKQDQLCQNNSWVDSGSCYAVSCATGYELINNTCNAVEVASESEISNDPFLNNTSYWIMGAGMSLSNGSISVDGTQTSNTIAHDGANNKGLITGKTYIYSIELANVVSGNVKVNLGGYDSGAVITTNGISSGKITITDSRQNGRIYLIADSTFKGSILSLSIIEEASNQIVSETVSSGDTVFGQKIFAVDFNQHAAGAYTAKMQESDFQYYNGEYLHYKNHDGSNMIGGPSDWSSATIVDDGGENVLRVKYAANKIHYASGTSGFLQVNALPKNNRPAEDINNPKEITLVYYLKFTSDFEWVYGGKLPGLAGGLIPSGGQELGGYKMENGFSARFMWELMWDRSGKPQGLKPYVYHPGRTGTTGNLVYGVGPYLSTVNPQTSLYSKDTSSGFIPETGRWYKITQTIKANTPYKSDGTMKVWIDDKLATEFGDMKYIADGMHGKYGVDRFCFSTFYGGGSSTWAPTRDTHIHFKDIAIYVK